MPNLTDQKRRDLAAQQWQQGLTYAVVGTGEFPFDMLRYDQAFPNTGDDAGLIAATRCIDSVEITLRSIKPPTVERWKSFGWTVINPVTKGM